MVIYWPVSKDLFFIGKSPKKEGFSHDGLCDGCRIQLCPFAPIFFRNVADKFTNVDLHTW